MRIRKRFLSLSAATDLRGGNNNNVTSAKINHNLHPQLSSQPRVQQQQEDQLHPNENQHVGCDNTPSPFSDPPNHRHRPLSPSPSITQIGLQPSTWVSSGYFSHPKKTKILKEFKTHDDEDDDDTGCRKESILCTQANNHDLVLKGWFQGENLVPVKRKRGSNGRRFNNDIVQENEMIDGTMKSPKLKKNDILVTMGSKMNMKKNETREGVIMEGSRCSRVNGRGWRCGQQTLVGYSLCEHHLGKGRVRSMSSVRGRVKTGGLKEQQHTKERKAKRAKSPLIDRDEIEYNDDYEEFKDWDVESMSSSMERTDVFSKKTKKVGVVKARSLSSLLSQISS